MGCFLYMKKKLASISRIHGWRKATHVNTRRRKATSLLALGALLLNLIVGGLLPSSVAGAATLNAGSGEFFTTVVICTPNGLRTISLDANGEPLPDQANYSEFCVFCLPLNDGHSYVPGVQITVLAPSLVRSRIALPLDINISPSIVFLESRPVRPPPFFS